MLFVVDLPPDILSGIRRSLVEERVRELLYAHRLGRCLLVVERDSYNWITKHIKLSGVDRATLEKIYNSLAQTGRLRRDATSYIRIAGPSNPLKRINEREISVPLDYQLFGNILMNPALVVEDAKYDVAIYRSIYSNIECRPGGYPTSYDPVHGGGSRIADITDGQIGAQRIVCAVIDSDKKSPFCPSTKRDDLLAGVAQPNWPLLFVFELPCSEIENLVPIDIYVAILDLNKLEIAQTLLKIIASENTGGPNSTQSISMFYDIKKGVSWTSFDKLANDQARDWIRTKLSIYYDLRGEFVVPGFGSHALGRLIDHPRFESAFRSRIPTREWQEAFGQFFSSVYWILMAANPQYAL